MLRAESLAADAPQRQIAKRGSMDTRINRALFWVGTVFSTVRRPLLGSHRTRFEPGQRLPRCVLGLSRWTAFVLEVHIRARRLNRERTRPRRGSDLSSWSFEKASIGRRLVGADADLSFRPLANNQFDGEKLV